MFVKNLSIYVDAYRFGFLTGSRGATTGTSIASLAPMSPQESLYVSMSRLQVTPDRVGELVTAFRGRAHLVDEAPGFVDLEVWCSDRVPGEVIMVSRWRDRAAFREYMRSGEHAASHARIDPDLDAAIQLERLEHLHTYDVVAR